MPPRGNLHRVVRPARGHPEELVCRPTEFGFAAKKTGQRSLFAAVCPLPHRGCRRLGLQVARLFLLPRESAEVSGVSGSCGLSSSNNRAVAPGGRPRVWKQAISPNSFPGRASQALAADSQGLESHPLLCRAARGLHPAPGAFVALARPSFLG